MYNSSKKAVWYGELRTSRGNTVIIYDKQFPEACSGRVYFYNSARDAIIEYAEEIVQPNLYELSGDALIAAEAKYDAAWNETRAAFMEKHSGWVEANNPKAVVKAKKDKPSTEAFVEPEEDAEPESETDDFNSGWSSDDLGEQ